MNRKPTPPAGAHPVIYVFISILLTACLNRDVPDASLSGLEGVNEVISETESLNQWLDERYEEELLMSPITLTELGRKALYDQIDDLSEAAEEKRLAWRARTVETMKSRFDYNALTAEAKISYDLWIHRYEKWREMAPYRRHDYVLTQQYGWHEYLPNFLINMHKVESIGDMRAYIERIRGISRGIRQSLERVKIAAGEGIRPPRFAYDGVISVSRNLLTGRPFDPSSAVYAPLWQDAQTKISGLLETGRINPSQAASLRGETERALMESFRPAYEALIEWMTADRVNAGQEAKGAGDLPDGEAYYRVKLQNSNDTGLGPGEIHDIGLSEVARIREEMNAIRKQVGFAGTLQEFFIYIKTDERFLYPDTDEGRQAYLRDSAAYLDTLEEKLPDYFETLPKAELVVRRVEAFRERDGAAQHYYPPAEDGSRPGIYYAHLSDMSSMPKNEMEAIAYHEGVPGHHLQVAIARELEDIPKFRTRGGTIGFVEGWALYAEYLAKEMGAYQNPYTNFGRLMTEMWRAVRLVVDTGIHAKGWSEKRAFNYFKANNPMSDGQMRAEIRRYFVMPGQATGYKIGMLKILELRRKARMALGDEFDIRGFHEAVIGGGPLPLSILEKRVDNWIASRLQAE